MELGNLLVAFFIVIIILSFLSLIPSKNQTGQFIAPSTFSIESTFIMIIFSILVIIIIKIPKKHYNPVPY